MTENTNTPFQLRCEILAELWLNYSNDPNFEDYFEYNDLGLPLAYSYANGIINYPATDRATAFIDEAWDLLLTGLELTDTGNYENLDELLADSSDE